MTLLSLRDWKRQKLLGGHLNHTSLFFRQGKQIQRGHRIPLKVLGSIPRPSKSRKSRTEVQLPWGEMTSAWQQDEQLEAGNTCGGGRGDPGTLQIQVGEGDPSSGQQKGQGR